MRLKGSVPLTPEQEAAAEAEGRKMEVAREKHEADVIDRAMLKMFPQTPPAGTYPENVMQGFKEHKCSCLDGLFKEYIARAVHEKLEFERKFADALGKSHLMGQEEKDERLRRHGYPEVIEIYNALLKELSAIPICGEK